MSSHVFGSVFDKNIDRTDQQIDRPLISYILVMDSYLQIVYQDNKQGPLKKTLEYKIEEDKR